MVILLLLFVFQRFGTKVVGGSFGPIMFVWFSMLAVLGLNQIIHYPMVLRALSPHYGMELLIQHPNGFWLLGAVFLCTTGAEALYSDLGHCGTEEYPGELDLCKDHAGAELSGSGGLGDPATYKTTWAASIPFLPSYPIGSFCPVSLSPRRHPSLPARR